MENEKSKKQTIKCDVHDCSHCDCSCDCCHLNEIKVCSCSEEETKEGTMCASYKKK